MLDTRLIALGGLELGLLLLVALIFLLFHVRGLRALINALEAKVVSLRDVLRGARSEAKAVRNELAEMRRQSRDFTDYLEDQIAATRNQHLSLQPDRDIVLDIAPDSPPERQALALRYALLIAEKESWEATEGKGCDWDVLSSKLGAIIDFYLQHSAQQTAASAAGSEADMPPDKAGLQETVESQQRQITNLEKFRKLYFDGEKRWHEASSRADGYLEELRALGQSLGGGSDFDALLQDYHGAYAGLGELLTSNPEQVPKSTVVPPQRVIVNQDEVNRLRNMAVDQHKVILQLKRQLADAESMEQKDAVIAELQKMLERQERFLKESETCTRLLEDELNRAIDENQQLREQTGAGEEVEAEGLQQLMGDLTRESREMLGAIAVLEEENQRLQGQLQDGVAAADETTALRGQLQEAHAELLALQQRYVELEERYLELKMQ